MKILARLLIVSVSLFSAYLIIVACSGGDWTEEEAKTSFFSQKLMVEKPSDNSFIPLFRKVTEPFYGNQIGSYDNNGLFTEQNVGEWTAHFNGEVPAGEISWILYESTLEEIDHLIFYAKDKNYSGIPGNLRQMKIFLLKDQSRVREFLYYTGFARRCEKVAVAQEDLEWNYESEGYHKLPGEDEQYLADLLKAAEKMMETPKSDFVKERYRFQITRLKYQQAYNFDQSYNECISYYESHKGDFVASNPIKYRAIGYVAAAFYKLRKYAEANYLYARIYENCPDMRTVAQYSFHPMEEADFRASLSLAVDNREKAALWHLLGIYGDELRAMKEIYALDPKSDLLNLLLVRNISKLEEKMLPGNEWWSGLEQYDDEGNPIETDHSYWFKPEGIAAANFDFIKNAADAGNTDKPFLWTFSTGYLYLVKGDYQKSRTYFSKAATQAGKDAKKLDQLRIMDILIKIAEPATVTAAVEASLVDDYHWLAKPSPKAAEEYYYIGEDEDQMKKEEVKAFLFKIFSEKYLRQGELLKALMCSPHCLDGFYSDQAEMESIAAWLLRKDKSPFEQILQNNYPYKVSDIYELQAIRAAYQGDIDGAIAKFEASGEGSELLLGNPFNIHIKDCHYCDHEAKQTRKFSKLDFLRELKLMEGIVAQKSSTSDYFLLANAYYNMTYFGNARLFYASAISDHYTYGTFYFPFSDNADYQIVNENNSFIFDCSKAEKYYLLAANSTVDKEMKAKCLFMAAKCEQNDFFCNKDAEDMRDFKAGKYFNILKSDFRDTKYYKEILRECGYFRKFNS